MTYEEYIKVKYRNNVSLRNEILDFCKRAREELLLEIYGGIEVDPFKK
jgi:hypothetical protein